MTALVFRRMFSIVAVLLLAAAFLAAQQSPPPAAPPAQPWSPEQLNTLVAPIALYPDALVSQVLVAATYPLEVVEAAQWLQQNSNLRGQQLVDAARQQNWDASVQALVAFPDVINRLNSDIRWTTDLGNAFLAQQADVMNAIQRMRAQARAAGQLNSNSQERVVTQTQGDRTVIEIQPANPEVVYVPVYNPEYIWGPPAWGYYPALYYPDYAFGFGPGIYIGGFFGGLGWGSWGWWPNWFGFSVFLNPFFFSHCGYHGYGFHGFHGGEFHGNHIWAHNPSHRLGVPYSSAVMANRFRGGATAGIGRGQFNGQRYANPRESSIGRMGPGGNFGRQGNSGARASSALPGRPQSNAAQAGGWHRFGESGSSSYGSANRSYAGSRSVPSYRPSPSHGGSSYARISPSYRPSPSYGSGYRPSYGSSYSGGRAMPSYGSRPSYGGGGHSSYRASPSYSSRSYSSGGGSYHGGGGGFHGGGGGGFHSGGGGGHHR